MKNIKYCITQGASLIFLMPFTVLFFVIGCTNEEEGFFNPVASIETIISALPEYAPIPVNNGITEEKVSLGRQLFWDPVLSGNKDVACATCHHPDKGYADALDLSIGVGGIGLGEQRTGVILAMRNAPTILNTAFNGLTLENEVNALNAPMFWDNRILSLEEQALIPLLSKEEMRGTDIPEDVMYAVIIKRLNAIPAYITAFENAFGSDEITTEKIAKAIAAFERTLVATNSPFDRYMRGDISAMTTQQIDGMNAFVNIGCAECHSGPMFSDFQLHTLGVPDNPKLQESDAGTGTYAFRTPTLRNLVFTAPYMHNGMHRSLEQVMDFYEDIAQGGDGDNDENDGEINQNVQPNQIDPLARQLEMDDEVINTIIAFMEALNDPDFDQTIPASVPSGLSVGGHINN